MESGSNSYARYLDGDESGIEDIVREYNDGLIFFINGYVNDLMTAEDLAADTFCKLLVKRKRFDNNGSAAFKTWLYTIARNTALDCLRKSSRRKSISLTDISGYDEESFDDTILGSEQKKALHEAINGLCSNYREVLHLLYFEELSYKQTAAVMRKSEKQVKNLAYRAKQALKCALEKENFTYENI